MEAAQVCDTYVWCTQISQLTEEFEAVLTRLELIQAGESRLTSCLDVFAHHFSAVKSRELLKRTHDLITRDLMDSIVISSSRPLGDFKKGDDEMSAQADIKRDEFVSDCRESAGTTGYKLPTCRVR